MARKRKLYLLIPFLYVGVVALLVYLQFSSGEAFQSRVGELSISGVERPHSILARSELKRISLVYHDVQMEFTRSRPLLFGTNRRRLKPVRYTLRSDGIAVIFSGLSGGEIVVDFRVAPEVDRLEITTRERGALGLPLESPGAEIRDIDGIPVLSVRQNDEMIFVSHPRETTARWAGGYLYLDGPDNSLTIGTADADGLYLQWFSSQARLATAGEYAQTLLSFVGRSYQGWREGRYVAADGAWRINGGQPQYSPTLVAALLAEAVERQEFSAVLTQVARAGATWLRTHPDAVVGGQASPFVGGLSAFRDRQIGLDRREGLEIERQIRAGDPALFAHQQLVRQLLVHSNRGLIETVLGDLAPNADVASMTIEAKAGLLEAIVDYRELDPQGAAQLDRVAGKVTRALISDIRVSERGLFVGPEPSDLVRSLRVGSILLRASHQDQDETLASLGRTIVGSCLSAAGDEGFLPAAIGSSAQGRVAPEDVYGLLTTSQYYPRLRPLGDGTWLWSSAELTSLDRQTGRVRLSFSFPAGVAHYILVQGIGPIRGVQIRGIPWRPDPEYFRYAAGWYYQSETKSLFIKLTQQSPSEDLVILM